jgi:hypothetical protein
MCRILLFSILTVVMSGIVNGQESSQNAAQPVEEIKKEVLKFEDDRLAAILKHDTATLDRMYSDQGLWTMPNGDLINKSQVLSTSRSGNQTLAEMKHSNRDLRVIADNVAILTEESRSTQIYKGKRVTHPRRFTNVYVKQDGQWKLVVHAVTFIAEP